MRRLSALTLALVSLFVLVGCGNAPTPLPLVATGLVEFAVPGGHQPGAITMGPDGNLWFTEPERDQLGRITPTGTITEFPLPAAKSNPAQITTGPDGNLWFTEADGNRLGRISPDGKITEFPLPTAQSQPAGITAGPDGTLWFTESGSHLIGRMTPEGRLHEFPVPPPSTEPFFLPAITTGSDGNLWFTEADARGVATLGLGLGRITPAGKVTQLPLSLEAGAITAGPDGNLWVTDQGGFVDQITPAGVFQHAWPIPGGRIGLMTTGPDRNVWIADSPPVGPAPVSALLVRITPAGVVRQYVLPNPKSLPEGMTTGPDGTLWFTETGTNQIGHVTPGR